MNAVAGRRVMIVEDNPLVGEIIADAVLSRGGEASGPFYKVDDALAFLDEGGEPDVAILDVNLDRTSFDVALRLSERNIPFVFATGNCSDIDRDFRDAIICLKPFTSASLILALRDALAFYGEDRRCA